MIRTTSAEAHRDNNLTGYLPRRQREVFNFLAANGPMTGDELDTKMKNVNAHKRLPELKTAGVVIETGYKTSAQGHKCILWGILTPPQGSLPGINPAAVVRPRTRKQLIEEIIMLEGEVFVMKSQLADALREIRNNNTPIICPEPAPPGPLAYFYTIPGASVPSPYFPSFQAARDDAKAKGVIPIHFWTGSHESPVECPWVHWPIR